jgi:hypothetical protein
VPKYGNDYLNSENDIAENQKKSIKNKPDNLVIFRLKYCEVYQKAKSILPK